MPMKSLRSVGVALVLLLLLAACGGDDGGSADQAPPATDTPTEVEEPAGTETTAAPDSAGGGTGEPTEAAGGAGGTMETGQALVEVASTDLGDILVDAEGMTLYLFTPDEQGESTCYDQCEQNWPPLLTDGDVPVGEGLDASLFGMAPREDGSQQATVNGWPLYYFAGDSAPGDVNGQGVNDVWYVVTPEGEAVMDGATESTASAGGGSDY